MLWVIKLSAIHDCWHLFWREISSFFCFTSITRIKTVSYAIKTKRNYVEKHLPFNFLDVILRCFYYYYFCLLWTCNTTFFHVAGCWKFFLFWTEGLIIGGLGVDCKFLWHRLQTISAELSFHWTDSWHQNCHVCPSEEIILSQILSKKCREYTVYKWIIERTVMLLFILWKVRSEER